MARTLHELTQKGDFTNWIPTDTYAATILEALQEKEMLQDVVGLRLIKPELQENNKVKIKKKSIRTAQGAIAEGNTLTETDQTAPTTVEIEMFKYGDADLLTAESMEDVTDDVKGLVLTSMGDALGVKLDELRMAALQDTGMTLHEVVNPTTKGQPTWGDVVDINAKLQQNNVSADMIIMHPTTLAYFLKTDPFQSAAVYGTLNALSSGDIGVMGGLRVIVTNKANALDTAINTILCVAIDSNLALVELYGRPITFSESYVQLTDQYREVCWIRYGVDAMNEEAIGWIRNAAV
jgi:HK97 family phage major capsid protein